MFLECKACTIVVPRVISRFLSWRFHSRSRWLFPFYFSNITLRTDLLTFGVTGAVFKIAGEMRGLPAYFDHPEFPLQHTLSPSSHAAASHPTIVCHIFSWTNQHLVMCTLHQSQFSLPSWCFLPVKTPTAVACWLVDNLGTNLKEKKGLWLVYLKNGCVTSERD